jgi:hypothetical protein
MGLGNEEKAYFYLNCLTQVFTYSQDTNTTLLEQITSFELDYVYCAYNKSSVMVSLPASYCDEILYLISQWIILIFISTKLIYLFNAIVASILNQI